MKIYVIGNSNDLFLRFPEDGIRQKFLVNQTHEGDNIDELNPWYCELTGLYYLWKNEKDDIIGLEHYRRYFLSDDKSLLQEDEINETLKDNDIILRRFIYVDHYQRDGFSGIDSLGIMKQFIEFLYQIKEPEFAIYCLHLLKTSKEFGQCNMFIGKREVIDKYCTWLFNTLNKVDFEYFKEFKRLFGYFGEFMFFAWIKFNNYKYTWKKTVTLVASDFNKVGEITPGVENGTT